MVSIDPILKRIPLVSRDTRSTIYRYIQAFQEDTDTLTDDLDDIRDSHYIDRASGGDPATGTVLFTVEQDALTEIPEGTVVSTTDGKQFVTTETISISSGGTFWGNDWDVMQWTTAGTSSTIDVEATIESVANGTTYNVDAGEITVLEDDVTGVVSVTNTSPTSGGIITQLDEIGKQFGELGQRRGRDDQKYRSYLKSIVQIFKFRGTIPGITGAVATSLDVEADDIEVYEHFNDDPATDEEYLEYTVIINDWDTHFGSTVEEVSQLADASMSRLRKTRYRTDENMVIDDTVTTDEGFTLSEVFESSDIVTTNTNTTSISEIVTSDDVAAINPNEAIASDTMSADDTVTTGSTTTSDTMSGDDTVATDPQPVNWGSMTWDESYWGV
jgi:hypothetical protein